MYAGVDLSTTTARCVIVDPDLNVCGNAKFPHTTLASDLSQSSDRWIRATEQAIGKALRDARVQPGALKSIGIATQGIASVELDDAGLDGGQATSWLDGTSDSSAVMAADEIADWYAQSGRRVSSSYLAMRLRDRPNPDSTRRYALAGDLLAFQLTGSWSIDPCLAATTGLIDQCARDWSDVLLDRVGIDRTRLSQIGQAGGVAGKAIGTMAKRLGLSPDTVVARPTQDQRAAVLIADPGEQACTITLGTASAIVARAPGGTSRVSGDIPLTPGLRPDLWWHEGVVPAAGVTFDWAATMMGFADTGDWLDLAAQCRPGTSRVRFDPRLSGDGSPSWDHAATGALTGIELDTSRAEIARAVLDAVCEQIAKNVALLSVVGDEIRLVGRLAGHKVVPEALTATLGRPLTRVIVDDPTALGAMLLGAQAAGHITSAAEAARFLVELDPVAA